MFQKVFLKLRNNVAPIAGAIVLAAGVPLTFGAGVAQAVPDGTTYHNILEDNERSLGWCGVSTGHVVTSTVHAASQLGISPRRAATVATPIMKSRMAAIAQLSPPATVPITS